MLYFDNSATSYPKPKSVMDAVSESFLYYGANPGRSGHSLAMKTAEKVFECRENAGKLFGISEPENIVFTKNCTEALNAVIMSIGEKGGHFIISDLEHNSVLRPLYELKNRGIISFSVAETFEGDFEKTVKSYENLMRSDTKMIVATGASNVFGTKLPVSMLGKTAHEHGALFLLDGAQTAGSEKIDMEGENIDFLCVPGHKGLLGPMGTGLLLTKRPELIEPQIFGGTGNFSLLPKQPKELPEMMESGTLNVPGICGLSAGIDKVLSEGEENIGKREAELACYIWDELDKMGGIKLFSSRPEYRTHAPVISFVIGDLSGEETARILSENNIAARGGFHCSALAHFKANTEKRGTCRISVGTMNSFDEAVKLIKIIASIIKNNNCLQNNS